MRTANKEKHFHTKSAVSCQVYLHALLSASSASIAGIANLLEAESYFLHADY